MNLPNSNVINPSGKVFKQAKNPGISITQPTRQRLFMAKIFTFEKVSWPHPLVKFVKNEMNYFISIFLHD